MRKLFLVLLFCAVALFPAQSGADSSPRYWPCQEGSTGCPTYSKRISVVDTIGVRDQESRREWNACGPIRLVTGHQAPYTPDTITIVSGERGDYPRGGWSGTYGILFLPPGSWERSIPVIRHEMGHALGFGHTKLWSIMGGSNHVQPIDCQGLRHYYRR